MILNIYLPDEDLSNKLVIRDLYYRPDDVKEIHASLRSHPHFMAVLAFTTMIDVLRPDIPNELKTLKELFGQVFGTDWSIDTPIEQIPCTWLNLGCLAVENEHAKTLRAKLLEWANTYCLVSQQPIYMELALRAIFYYRPDIHGFENVCLSRGLTVPRDMAVNEFKRNHPFVFAPSKEHLSEPSGLLYGARTIKMKWDEPERYENIPSAKSHDSKEWNGFSWDPRQEHWKSFLDPINEAFKCYCRGYERRMREFMEQNGYIEVPKGDPLKSEELSLHMQWFFEFHINDMDIKDITQHYSNVRDKKGIDDRTVPKALEKMADRLFLEKNI